MLLCKPFFFPKSYSKLSAFQIIQYVVYAAFKTQRSPKRIVVLSSYTAFPFSYPDVSRVLELQKCQQPKQFLHHLSFTLWLAISKPTASVFSVMDRCGDTELFNCPTGVTILLGVEEYTVSGASSTWFLLPDSFHFASAGIKIGFCQSLDISRVTICLELGK